MWKLNLLFLISLLITFLLLRHEVRRYAAARLSGEVTDQARKRFTRRIVSAVVLVMILAMTYFGYTNKAAFIGRPWFFGIYWLSCIFMALALIVLAIIDMRAVFQTTLKEYINESAEEERFKEFLKKNEQKGE